MEPSFRRLDTDYIDIFMFHGVSKDSKLDEIISNGLADVLLEEKEKGRIGHIGFSSHNPDIIERYYDVVDFPVIMIPVNFVSTEFVDKNYEKLVEKDIGILGMKPLGGGRLEDIRICLKFINQYQNIIPLIGIQDKKELKQDLKLINTDAPPDKADKKRIVAIKHELGDKFCRGCGYCLPCSQDIDIPNINFIKVFFKQFDYDRVVNPERDAVMEKVEDCIECGECIKRCPYDLDIINMIKENRDYYLMRRRKGR